MALQAGFIGTWGEWYFSKNYATLQSDGSYSPTAAQQTNRMKIIAALLDALPANRMLQLRTPNFKMVSFIVKLESTKRIQVLRDLTDTIPVAILQHECKYCSGESLQPVDCMFSHRNPQ